MGHGAFALGEHLEVLTHLVGSRDLRDGGPRQVDGLGAGLIRFFAAGAS